MFNLVGKSRGIRQRVTLVNLGVICLALMILVAATRLVIFPGFAIVEEREAKENWERVEQTLVAQVDLLETRAYDWAEWDDAFQFVQDGNSGFVESNISNKSLAEMELSSMAFFRSDGKVLLEEGTDAKSGSASRLFGELNGYQVKLRKSGLLKFDGDLKMFTLWPVKQTGGVGAAKGWLLWTQTLDSAYFARLSEQLKFKVNAMDVDSRSAEGVVFNRASDHELVSLGVINDFRGEPLFGLSVSQGRTIFQDASAVVDRMVFVQAITFLGALFVLSVTIGRYVVRRIERMEREIREVDTVTGSGFVTAEGGDEIESLGVRINSMLSALSDSAGEIEGQREELVEINNSLERAVFERTERLERLNGIFAHALDGIGELDATGRILNANLTMVRLLGGEELRGRSFVEWLVGSSAADFVQAVGQLVYDARVEAELVIDVAGSGRRELQCVLVRDWSEHQGLRGMHLFIKDVTEHRKIEREMVHQARRDSLTGLGNRRLLHDNLENLLGKGDHPVVVLFMDLDNFKLINDSRGHKVGDRLLRAVAEIMTSESPLGSEVYRMGGDEFMVVLVGENALETGENLAIRLLDVLSQPVDVGDGFMFVSCSVGLAQGIPGKTSAIDLIRDGDTAMYQAKANGKAGYSIYDDAMNAMVLERLEIEEGLRFAIEHYQLLLVYQPIIEIGTGRVKGLEALLRWVHPKLGMISPTKFIPIAEETGLIVPIGEWVLKESMQALAYLRTTLDLDITMNINMSQRQLSTPNVADLVQNSLNEAGLSGPEVMIEITESMAMEDIDRTVWTLNELKTTGVGLAIDDFGTGFSSLSSLQQLPIDKVKIDRSFIESLGMLESRHFGVVEAIIQLCRALELEVVAEGIETLDQLEILHGLGCEYGQGFYWAKPMNLRALEAYLHEFDVSKKAA